MKIVYFAHSVLNRGGDKMVLAHLGHLAESGHQVTLRCNVVATDFPLHHAFRFEKPLFPTKLGTLMSAVLERQHGDVVIGSIIPTAVLLRLRNPGRALYFAQDDNQTAYGQPLALLMRFLYNLAFGALSIPCVTVSHTLAAMFRSSFGATCPVVENGVDTTLFYRSPSPELLTAKGDRKAIMLLSRCDKRKGSDLAREAVECLAARAERDFEVWTLGERFPWTNPPVPHRDFGCVGEAAVREIMSSADLFLYPSRSEGFPLMVLEAFACGCPVVTTEAVGYAKDGDNALVAPIGDVAALVERMERLLSDEALAGRVVQGGYEFVSEHTLTESGVKFEQQLAGLFPVSTHSAE